MLAIEPIHTQRLNLSTTSVAPTTTGNPVLTHRQIMYIISGLMAAMFLSSLNGTVVGTAMRTIADDLNGLDQQVWVSTAFLVTSTVMTPIYGKLSDIFGRRPLFIIAIVIFLVGSLLSGFANSMYMLAAFRAIQGIGAGGLMSLPLTVMGDILAPRERAKYQGYFLAVFGVSTVIGPLVGGLFAGADQILFTEGWRWVFFINVPVGLVALWLVARFLHIPKHPRKVRVDYWGAVTLVVGTVPLLLIAEQGQSWGWTSWGAWLCYIIGVLGIVAFILVERFMGDDALIPLKLFKSPTFSMATILSTLVGAAMFGGMFVMPLFLQIVLGMSPTEAGWATLPMVGGLMVASIASGQIISRTGKYKVFVVIGALFLVASFFVLTFETYDKPFGFTVIGMVLLGLGLGQVMQPLTLAAQNSVGVKDMGVATSSATFFRQMGGTLGIAVLFSVLFNRLGDTIKDSFADKSLLTPALNAALDPAVAGAPQNAKIMDAVYTPLTSQVVDGIDQQLATATQQVTDTATQMVTQKVTDSVNALVAAGRLPASAAPGVIQQQVQAALPDAIQQGLQTAAQQAGVSVQNGALAVDWTDAAQRSKMIDQVIDKMSNGGFGSGGDTSGLSSSLNSDTSFLNTADHALSAPLLNGFATATVTIFWVSLGVAAVAFLLSFFLKAVPLRAKSAAQEAADQRAAEQLSLEAQAAANEAGAIFEAPAFVDAPDDSEDADAAAEKVPVKD